MQSPNNNKNTKQEIADPSKNYVPDDAVTYSHLSTTLSKNSGKNSVLDQFIALQASIFIVPYLSADDDFLSTLRKIFASGMGLIAGMSILPAAIYYSVRAAYPTIQYPLSTFGSEEAQRNGIILLAICYYCISATGMATFAYLRWYKAMPPHVLQVFFTIFAFDCIFNDLTEIFFPSHVVGLFLAVASVVCQIPYPYLVVLPLIFYYIITGAREAWNPYLSDNTGFLRLPPRPWVGENGAERFVFFFPGILFYFELILLAKLIMTEYMWQRDAAEKSAKLAQDVSKCLLSYDTDKCREILDEATKNAILSRHEFGSIVTMLQDMRMEKDLKDREEAEAAQNANTNGVLASGSMNNSTNKKSTKKQGASKAFQRFGVSEDLCIQFRRMCDNLDRYRPHIPDWAILDLDGDEAEMAVDKPNDSHGSAKGDSHVGHNNNNNNNTTLRSQGGSVGDDEEMRSESEGSECSHNSAKSDMSVHNHQNMNSSSRNMNNQGKSQRGVVVQMPGFDLAADSRNSGRPSASAMNNNNNNNTRHHQNALRKLGQHHNNNMQPHAPPLSGLIVERVVVARINFSRVAELVFDRDLRSFLSIAVPRINELVTTILDQAAINDATVHSLIGDVMCCTFNSTTKILHSDIKSCKFLTQLPELLLNTLVKHGSNNHNNNNLITNNNRKKSGTNLVVSNSGGNALKKSNSSNNNNTSNNIVHEGSSVECDPAVFDEADDERLWNTRVLQIIAENEEQKKNLLFGAAVSGSAWAQLSGSSRRQIFLLSVFSHERVLDEAMRCAIKGGFFVVCRHIQSNAAHEYYLRGCSVLPYAHLVENENDDQGQTQGQRSSQGARCMEQSQRPQIGNQNNNFNTNNINNSQKPSIGSPLYELVSRKALAENTDDEWLYQLQTGNTTSPKTGKPAATTTATTNAGTPKNNNNIAANNNNSAPTAAPSLKRTFSASSSEPLGLALCDVVASLARANMEKANSVMSQMRIDQPEVVHLAAYKMVDQSYLEIGKLVTKLDGMKIANQENVYDAAVATTTTKNDAHQQPNYVRD